MYHWSPGVTDTECSICNKLNLKSNNSLIYHDCMALSSFSHNCTASAHRTHSTHGLTTQDPLATRKQWLMAGEWRAEAGSSQLQKSGRLSTSHRSAKRCLFVSFTTSLSKLAHVLFDRKVSRVRGRVELVVSHDSG